MKSRNSDYLWIPLWIDKWIFGSTRIECNLEERSIWVDFMALAGKDNGYIRANETTPYLIDQLAGLLIIPKNILENAIQTFIRVEKLEDYNGIYKIKNWEIYKLSDSYRRVIKHRIKKNDHLTKRQRIRQETDNVTDETKSVAQIKSNQIISNQNINNRFDIFWQAYPKKKSKGKAEIAFKKINPGEQFLATILAKIEQAKTSIEWTKEQGQFIPYPATWLNAKGWEDVYIQPEEGKEVEYLFCENCNISLPEEITKCPGCKSDKHLKKRVMRKYEKT